MKKRIDENKREEVKRILEAREKPITKKINLIFDGKQYSLKLPKKILDELEVNLEEYFFRLNLTIPPHHLGEEPKLTMELMKNEK